MFCGYCGAQLEDGSLFCPECGHSLEAGQADMDLSDKIISETEKMAGQETVMMRGNEGGYGNADGFSGAGSYGSPDNYGEVGGFGSGFGGADNYGGPDNYGGSDGYSDSDNMSGAGGYGGPDSFGSAGGYDTARGYDNSVGRGGAPVFPDPNARGRREPATPYDKPRNGSYKDPRNRNNAGPEEEQKSSLGMYIGLGVAIVALVGGIIFGIIQLMNGSSSDGDYVAPKVESSKGEESTEEGLKEDNVDISDAQEDLFGSEDSESDSSSTSNSTNNNSNSTANNSTSNNSTTNNSTNSASNNTAVDNNANGTNNTTNNTVNNNANSAAAVSNGDYVFSDSSTRYLSESELASLSAWQIRIARNEIYARHGRMFKDSSLDQYFRGKTWYSPSVSADNFTDDYLNEIEKANAKMIASYEASHGINQ